MSEKVEVKVQLPKPIYDVIVELCAIKKITVEEYLHWSIINDLEAYADANFDDCLDDLAKKTKTIIKALKEAEAP
jgi:hypothetical protein